MSNRSLAVRAVVFGVLLPASLAACGGPDVPPAPPGVPINPPQENTALAAMLAETPSTPPPTASAAAQPPPTANVSASASATAAPSAKATKPPPAKKP